MVRTTLNWTVKNLKTMHDEKDTLSFSHPIQRISGQWTNEQQSLLIHSLLDNFPVPAVYIHKMESVETDAKGKHSYSYSVLDGKQRMTTIFSFINGEFALADNTPDVTVEDEVHEIAGKYFEDLAEDIQQEILRFKFNIQCFEDVDDETIEEIFFRLNNSSPLTKPQKAKPLMGVANSIFVNDILDGRFFKEKCNFTAAQRKNSADLCTLLQSMMLLDYRYRDYTFDSISDDAVMTYSKWINGNYSDECKCRVKKIVNFLDNLFYMKDKNLRKVNIPILFLMADDALKQSITGASFRRWYEDFFEKHKEEYNQFCSSGSIKKEKTIGRIEVMEKYFNEYFRPEDDEPEQEEPLIEAAELESAEPTDTEELVQEESAETNDTGTEPFPVEGPDEDEPDNTDDEEPSGDESSDEQESSGNEQLGDNEYADSEQTDGEESVDNVDGDNETEQPSDDCDSDSDNEADSVSEDADNEVPTDSSVDSGHGFYDTTMAEALRKAGISA